MIHIIAWILAVFAFIALLGFPPVWHTIGYWRWRLLGGLPLLLRSYGVKTIAEGLSISDPHYLDVGVEKWMFAHVATIPNDSSSENIVLQDELVLLEDDGSSEQKICVDFRRVFPVSLSSVRHGCHGHYRLAKSLYLSSSYGGDPICGGGIKHYFAPRIREWWEWYRLKKLVTSKKSFSAFGQLWSNGTSGIYYPEVKKGYVPLYIGEKSDVEAYASQNNFSIKPITVRVV